MKPERVLLQECLDLSERLTDEAAAAFADMLEELESGRRRELSTKQLEWVLTVHKGLGLDPGAENLVSTGQVKPTEAERQGVRDMLSSLGPKVLLPPGRRA